jgi:hypothetical protein
LQLHELNIREHEDRMLQFFEITMDLTLEADIDLFLKLWRGFHITSGCVDFSP